MALPDNRIKIPGPKIDFSQVGLTGQDHDDYPPEAGQARFDHMRMFLIGLLSLQSSSEPPTQFRQGTPWFDLRDNTLKIRLGNEWVDVADVISVAQPGETDSLTLSQFVREVQEVMPNLSPDIVFNGVSTGSGIASIPIPTELRSSIQSGFKPLVYINGILVDPRSTSLESPANPTSVKMTDTQLSINDRFTVIIRYIPDRTFYTSTVTVS